MDQQPLRDTTFALKIRIVLAISTSLLLTVACGGPAITPETSTVPQKPYLPRMGFSIQVGAFSNINNAVRLTASLQQRGINAYHFLHDSGLYKVRFENYKTRAAASKRGEDLKRQGIIAAFYIVDPQDAAAAKGRPGSSAQLRNAIVTTASRYVGVPYRWGGRIPPDGI